MTACTRRSKVSGSPLLSVFFSGIGLYLGSASGLVSEQATIKSVSPSKAARWVREFLRMVNGVLRCSDVLLTQGKHPLTDTVSAMSLRFSFIFSLCLWCLLTACGGGGGAVGSGGSGDDGVSSKTVSLFSAALNEPKHMVFKDGNLYVANTGTNSIKNVSTGTDYFSSAGFLPFGMAVYANDLFFTGTNNAFAGIFKNQTRIVIKENLYGIGFANGKLYVADNAPNQIATYDIANNFSLDPVSRTIPQGFIQGIGVLGTEVFVTVLNPGSVVKVSGATLETMPWGNFTLPNAIVFDGTYAYIANKGTVNGEGGFISRKKMSDASSAEVFINATTGTWKTTNPGFCGLAGLAISGSYLYASNGTCSSGNNANTILKIKL